jgi:hypothetical protein
MLKSLAMSPENQIKRPFLPSSRNGIKIDLLIIFINLVIFPLMFAPMLRMIAVDDKDIDANMGMFALLMLIVTFGRIGGLYLKRFPLQARLTDPKAADFPGYFFIFNIALAVVGAAMLAVLFQYILGQIGIIETGYNGLPKENGMVMACGLILMFAVVGAEIYFLIKLSKPLSAAEKKLAERGDRKFGPIAEFIADYGLFLYMMVWQFVYFYCADLLLTEPNGAPLPLNMKAVGLIFMVIIFVMFYLTPRAVFLMEDRKYPATWIFIGLVFLSSIIRHW